MFACVEFSALDTCQLNPCPDPYAICRISDDGERECTCPAICTADYSPVCGTDGQTYSNLCLMKVSACEQGMMIKVKSPGKCKSKWAFNLLGFSHRILLTHSKPYMKHLCSLLHSQRVMEMYAQPVITFFIADNPGFCPIVDPQICSGDLDDSCFDDASCDVSEKCCHDGCRKLCVKSLSRPNAGGPPKAMSR